MRLESLPQILKNYYFYVMKLINNIKLIALLTVFLSSCGIPMGNRIDKGNLKVYYLEGVTKEDAIDFANFWVDEGYVGEQEQIIQLEAVDDIVWVKIIESINYQDEPLSIHEQAMLQEIERDLNKSVFDKNAILQITDNTFRPLDRVNN